MVQRKRARVPQENDIASVENSLKRFANDLIEEFKSTTLPRASKQKYLLKSSEAEREKLSGKVQSLENQAKNYKNQSKKLERRLLKIEK